MSEILRCAQNDQASLRMTKPMALECWGLAQNDGSVGMLRNQGKGKNRVKADCHAPLHNLKAQAIATAGARNDEPIVILSLGKSCF